MFPSGHTPVGHVASAPVYLAPLGSDQGCQFTSAEWTGRLLGLGVKISMDGKGRWMDNVFIERLWRSVKYEEIYLFEHATIIELYAGLEKWFERYNHWRPHASLGNQTPAVVYAAENSGDCLTEITLKPKKTA